MSITNVTLVKTICRGCFLVLEKSLAWVQVAYLCHICYFILKLILFHFKCLWYCFIASWCVLILLLFVLIFVSCFVKHIVCFFCTKYGINEVFVIILIFQCFHFFLIQWIVLFVCISRVYQLGVTVKPVTVAGKLETVYGLLLHSLKTQT